MSCRNPDFCKKKNERWIKNQKKYLKEGQEEHEKFLSYVNEGTADIAIRSHADKRTFERVVSNADMTDVILNGWVIERNINYDSQAVRLVILGYTRKYRPIHVVCEIINEKEWEVVTVYNPESQAYKWTNNFQERICFCKN